MEIISSFELFAVFGPCVCSHQLACLLVGFYWTEGLEVIILLELGFKYLGFADLFGILSCWFALLKGKFLLFFRLLG